MIDITIVFILAVISGYFFPIVGDILSLATIVMGIVYARRRQDRRLLGLGIVLGATGLIVSSIFAGQIEIYGVSPLQITIAAAVLIVGVLIALIRKDIRFAIAGVILGALALLGAGIATSTVFIYGLSLPPILLGIVVLLALVGFLIYTIRVRNLKLAGLFGAAIVAAGVLLYFSVRQLPGGPLSQKIVPGQTSKQAAKKGIVETPERKKAMELYHQGKFAEARPLLEKIVKENPKDYDALYKLGSVYENTAEGDKAIATYDKVTKIKPDFWEAYYSLGYITWKYGKFNQSERALKKAIELEPKAIGAHTTLAELYFQKKQYAKAIDQFKAAITSAKGDPSYQAFLHNRIAQVYMAQKKTTDAVKEWRAALELDPQNAEANSNLEKYGS